MGRMIAAAARDRGHEVAAIVDPQASDADYPAFCPEAAAKADMAIEFTMPSQAVDNIRAILGVGLPGVIGTTGWHGRLEEVRGLVKAADGRLVYGSNFSIGVNLFYAIVAEAARLMDGFPQYDVAGFEVHHAQKADSPSGTAKALAAIVMERVKRKRVLLSETLADRRPAPEELHFTSLRAGSVPGTHSVIFDSPYDSIELTHTARTREGFARGAVMAAEWLAASPRRGLIPVEEVFGFL
jgi:4-hydroxy-tetrahydrodipicolinate reductase